MMESFCYISPEELDRLQVGFIRSYPPPPPCPTQTLVVFSSFPGYHGDSFMLERVVMVRTDSPATLSITYFDH